MSRNFEREVTEFLSTSKDIKKNKRKHAKVSRTQSDLQTMTDNRTDMSGSEIDASNHNKSQVIASNSFAYEKKPE